MLKRLGFKHTEVVWFEGIVQGLAEIISGLVAFVTFDLFATNLPLFCVYWRLSRELPDENVLERNANFLRWRNIFFRIKRQSGQHKWTFSEWILYSIAHIVDGFVFAICLGKLTTSFSMKFVSWSCNREIRRQETARACGIATR